PAPEADRPLLRRRLPHRLHRRAPRPPCSALGGRAESRGAEPRAGLGNAAGDGQEDDRGRLGDRRAHPHAPGPDDGLARPPQAGGRRLAAGDQAPLRSAGRLLLLPVRPLRRRGGGRREGRGLSRRDDDQRGARDAARPLHAEPRPRERNRRCRGPTAEAGGSVRRVKRVLLGLLVVLVLLVGAAAAFVLYRKHQGRNVHGSSSVEFVTTQAPTRKRTPVELRTIPWPMYGLDAARTRFADGIHLRPPFRRLWLAGGTSLLEFPPAVGYGRLFLSNNSGSLFALGARNGGRAWTYKTHRCTAASPALNRGTVFASFMNRGACNQTKPGLDGLVAALSVGLGKVRWTTKIGPTESSPLVADGRVFVGDWRGKVYALEEGTGKIVWSYQTGGKVKGGIALSGGRLFVGAD